MCLGGCAIVKAPPHTFDPRAVSPEDVRAHSDEVRLKMRSLLNPMCGEIERIADEIAAASTDPRVQKAALEWKIDAVPALRKALYQPSPFVAMADGWVFLYQMADFYETGPGRTILGDSAAVAAACSRRLEQAMANEAATLTISGDISRARVFAKQWAAQHPIRHSLQERESVLGEGLGLDAPESRSTGEALHEVITTLDDLNRKVDHYGDYVFRQTRWEVELLGSDLRLAEVIPLSERAVQSAERAATTVDQLAPHIERTLGIAQDAPALIASERKAAIEAFAAELTRTITFLQEERIHSFEQLDQQRIAAFTELQKDMSDERKAAVQDLEVAGLRLVDHTLWRVAQLMAAGLVFLVLSALVGLLLARRFFAPGR
jgi:hypothetical protein